GLDDVDAHLVEELGNLKLLLMGHGGARALLAVAQGGIEDEDAVLLGLRWRAHDVDPSRLCALSPGAPGFRACGLPSVRRRKTPGRRSGDDKEPEPTENEGAAGQALSLPGDRADIAARRHFALVTQGRGTEPRSSLVARRF